MYKFSIVPTLAFSNSLLITFLSYFGMFSEYIHDFECVCIYIVFTWCLDAKKMWERKGKYIFFSLIYLVSKKLEETER